MVKIFQVGPGTELGRVGPTVLTMVNLGCDVLIIPAFWRLRPDNETKE